MPERLPLLSPACPYCTTFCGPPEERAAHIRRFHGIEAQLASRSWSLFRRVWRGYHPVGIMTILGVAALLVLGLLLR